MPEMTGPTGQHRQETSSGLTLIEFLRVLRRRKWLILLVLVLTPLAAIYLSLQQERLYEASADVLLSRENLAANLTPGAVDPTVYQQPERVAQTQADLARVPTVVRRVLDRAGLEGRSTAAFLENSDVEPKSNSDLLRFRVRDGDRALAVRLATTYAREYTNYRRELDTAALAAARRKVESRIAELEREGERRSPLYASLVQKQEQLETLEALKTSNSTLVQPAERTEQVQPLLVRNTILAVALAIVLGLGLAFLWEALDTRVRTAEEIGALLQLPLLARLPAPPAKLRKQDALVMLGTAHGPEAEAFRMLRTNLEFVSLDHPSKTIMVTSALPREGKSTSVANLAVAVARAGKRVTLVDLDFRRPFLHRFFDVDGRRGVTEVALRHVGLNDALVSVPLADRNGSVSGDGGRHSRGALNVLTSGLTPPDPGEFVAGHALARVMEEVREQSELVLIDSPPSLGIGDALSLSGQVDGIIVVVHSRLARRPILKELRRILGTTRAPILGFVLTGAEVDEGYGYSTYQYAAEEAERGSPRAVRSGSITP